MKPAGAQPRRARAFTLIEVLLAVTIFALVLAAMNTVLYGAFRLRNHTEALLAETSPVERTVAILKRDLCGLMAPAGGTLVGALQSNAATSPLDRTGTQISPDLFTCTGVIDDTSPWAEVQRVSYALVDPTNQTIGKDLLRSVTRNLLAVVQEQPTQQRLLSGVAAITFLYYDGTSWKDTWDSTTATTNLPTAIKVQIELAKQDRGLLAPPLIEVVAPIVVQSRSNEVQQATGGQP